MKENSRNGILFTFIENEKPDEDLYKEVLRIRNELKYPMILVDIFEDFLEVNQIISRNTTTLKISNNQVTLGFGKANYTSKSLKNPNQKTLLEILKEGKINQQ